MSKKPETLVIRELTLAYKPTRFPRPEGFDRKIETSRDIDAVFREFFDIPFERLGVLFLNAKNGIIGYKLWSGSTSSCPVNPGDLFRAALLANANAVVMMHNHPAGDPTPSAEDIALTDRVVRGGQLLGVRVLDHIVFGDGRYFSFTDAGLLVPTS